MKNLGVLNSMSLFLGLALLEEARQGVSHSIRLSLIIINSKVVLKKILGLMNLIRAQTFYIHQLSEIIMVSKDKDLIFAALQVKTLSFQGFNNSQDL